MKTLIERLRPHFKLIGTIVLIIGVALLSLSVWGFVKGSHSNMSGKNGAKFTIYCVNARWVNMPLGAIAGIGGFLMLKNADTADDSEDEQDEDDDLSDIP